MAPDNTTIKIADEALVRVNTSASRVYTSGDVGGIYNTRERRPGSERRLSFASMANVARDTADENDGEDWRRDDGRKKQVFKGTTLLWLAYQSIGTIYGDIGTSPLYVYSSTFTDVPTPNDVVQVLSVIIWTITIMVTIKYVLIILRADNEGEGGTFSCYSLLTRYANITNRDPREQATVHMERYRTNDLHPANKHVRSSMEQSKFIRVLLKLIGVLAVSMVMADGILTPAQSVLGAVQGLSVVSPDISSATIVGVSCAILVCLFLIQPLGLTRLASGFAPIVIVWLLFNATFGIYNLVKFDASVLRAFSPFFAGRFFVDRGTDGWRMLGGILLSFTGVEALFADLGAFSMRAVQISWCGFAYPCLLLAYVGQAAYISVNPEAYSNAFFNSVPPGMLYPSLVVAVLAAIVASQAMITATFQMTSQIMKLSYCPQIKVVHTSRIFHGQLYVPFLNWILMGGTVLVTAVYSNTTRLGNAYGVCVMFVTFFDTCMVTLVALIVWRLPPWVVALPWLCIACVDGLYLSAALEKVPLGAWFTITIAGILACVFLLWRYGKENQWRAEAEDTFPPSRLIVRGDGGGGSGGSTNSSVVRLTDRYGGDVLSRIRGLGIFFDKTGVMTPHVFTQFVHKFGTLPQVSVFLHLHPVEVPTVEDESRCSIAKVGAVPGCYRLVIRHGYMDEIITPNLGALVHREIRAFVVRQALGRGFKILDETAKAEIVGQDVAIAPTADMPDQSITVASPEDVDKVEEKEKKPEHVVASGIQQPVTVKVADDAIQAELDVLDESFAHKVVYIVGKEQMRIKQGTAVVRMIVLAVFLWIRENSRTKIANLRLDMDRVVEVGFVKEI